jgi:uncharacterized protein (TIGR00730 family)
VPRICVFAGSSAGTLEDYTAAARTLAEGLVRRRITLVYGGANIGLMGVLADTVLECGGEVIGVIPGHLVAREVAHTGLSELRVVDSMHERKTVMADLSDAVVALPGGLGTLEELFEMLTWAQLGLHRKPCGLLNVAGYFDRLLSFLDHAVDQRFVTSRQREMLLADSDPIALLDRLTARITAPRTGLESSLT